MSATKIIAYDAARDERHPPDNVYEFISFLQEQLALIPAKYRDTAEMDVFADLSWGDPVLVMRMTYSRPESDEEERMELKSAS